MALPDLTNQYIQDTYQRLLQVSSSGDITDGTGSLFIPPNAISASYAVSASYEIIKEISSSYADTASYVNPLRQNVQITGSLSVVGTTRTAYTISNLVYSGSNVVQVTQSFEAGTQQITDITYSGSFSDGNPLTVAVTGSDGINKLYTMTYSGSNITQILVT